MPKVLAQSNKRSEESKKEGISSEQREAIEHNIKEGFSGLTPGMGLTPGIAQMGAEDSSAMYGLINNSAAIHEDIRKTARKMDIEPPSME